MAASPIYHCAAVWQPIGTCADRVHRSARRRDRVRGSCVDSQARSDACVPPRPFSARSLLRRPARRRSAGRMRCRLVRQLSEETQMATSRNSSSSGRDAQGAQDASPGLDAGGGPDLSGSLPPAKSTSRSRVKTKPAEGTSAQGKPAEGLSTAKPLAKPKEQERVTGKRFCGRQRRHCPRWCGCVKWTRGLQRVQRLERLWSFQRSRRI
jgi:hypothetical protein